MPTVIIIGASSGLGKQIAMTYIARGYRVGVAARRVDRLAELTALAPERVTACRLDVTADDAADSLDRLIAKMGTAPDIFINCAGIGFANPDLDTKLDLDTVMTNCVGFTRVVDHIFNYYATHKLSGQIVDISSVAGTRGIGIAASYSASKRFQTEYLTALSQLAHQRRLPITVNDIRPGFVKTPLLDADTRYPMIMNTNRAAALIVKAIDHKSNRIIDRRWAVITWVWKHIPRWLWRRISLRLSTDKH